MGVIEQSSDVCFDHKVVRKVGVCRGLREQAFEHHERLMIRFQEGLAVDRRKPEPSGSVDFGHPADTHPFQKIIISENFDLWSEASDSADLGQWDGVVVQDPRPVLWSSRCNPLQRLAGCC